MLTAAAVKIAGGGLGNDQCNILNEDLYDEAMSQDITFDQYHKWLERRLEQNAEPDQHDSPARATMKTKQVESPAVAPPASAPDTRKLRISLKRMF